MIGNRLRHSAADLRNLTALMPAKETLWSHTATCWLLDMAMLIALGALLAGFVQWRIRIRTMCAPMRPARHRLGARPTLRLPQAAALRQALTQRAEPGVPGPASDGSSSRHRSPGVTLAAATETRTDRPRDADADIEPRRATQSSIAPTIADAAGTPPTQAQSLDVAW
jgi:hypothetical protein